MSGKGELSVLVATAVGLGAIIGAGIFVLSGTAIATAGANALVAFILVGIVAIFVALQIGELGSIFPHLKGGVYSYVYNAFGSELGFITGILLYSSYVTAITVIALGFGAYFVSFPLWHTTLPPALFAGILIVILAIINIRGIKSVALVDFALVVIKVLVLMIFIVFAISVVFKAHTFPTLDFTTSASQGTPYSLFYACVIIFFAYSGFQIISTFFDKVKGGHNAAVKAILYSVVISIILYVLVVFGLMLLVPSYTFTTNTADPLTVALNAVNASPWLKLVIELAALIATTSATLAGMLQASRTLYQISKDHLLPSFVRSYDPKNDVAPRAVFVSMIISIVVLFLGNISVIVALSDFGLIFAYMVVSFSLIHFKRLRREGTFKAPFYPYLSIVSIIILMLFMYGMPQESLFLGTVLILSSIIVYYSLREIEGKREVRVKLFK